MINFLFCMKTQGLGREASPNWTQPTWLETAVGSDFDRQIAIKLRYFHMPRRNLAAFWPEWCPGAACA